VTSVLAMARSVLFNVLFFVTTTLFVVIGSPFLVLPRSWAMAALKVHARFELFLLRLIVGTKIEVRGREKIPDGPCLVASKHQSAWETFALIPIFRDPALLMKREIATAALAVMPNCGHTINLEDPDQFNRLVGDFIAQVEAGRWPKRDPRAMTASITGMR